MTSLIWQNLLITILLPVCLTAAGLFLLRLLPERLRFKQTSTAVVLAVVLGVACVGIRGWAGFWPVDITQRLPLIALGSVLGSGLVEVVSARKPRLQMPLSLSVSLLISALIAGIFTGTAVFASHSLFQKILWWGTLTLVLGTGRWLASWRSPQRTTFGMALWLAGGFVLIAAAVSSAGSLSLGQISLAYAVSLAMPGVMTGITPGQSPLQAVAELSATMAGMILTSAWLFAELNPLMALVLFGMLSVGSRIRCPFSS